MTDEKRIELIEELAEQCCALHTLHVNQKTCMNCWRRTSTCDKWIILSKLVDEGCRLVPKGEWLTDKYGMERSICSICGAVFEGDGGNYCRKCGARMTEDI